MGEGGREQGVSMARLVIFVAVAVFVASCAGTMVGMYGPQVVRQLLRWLGWGG